MIKKDNSCNVPNKKTKQKQENHYIMITTLLKLKVIKIINIHKISHILFDTLTAWIYKNVDHIYPLCAVQ